VHGINVTAIFEMINYEKRISQFVWDFSNVRIGVFWYATVCSLAAKNWHF